jgi:hypothetical protein
MMCSGVPNTTVGNTIVNAAVSFTALVRAGARPGEDFAIMVRGDDMLALVKPEFHACIAPFAQRLGFKPKVKSQHSISKVRFCSNAFYPTIVAGVPMHVPAPTFKCLMKMMWTISPVPVKAYAQHMRGVALGLKNLVSHVPILRDYIAMILRQTEGQRGRFLKQALKDAKIKYLAAPEALEATPQSESYVAEMYGLSLAMVSALRTQVGEMTAVGLYNSTAIEFLVRGVLRAEG